ncbi:hypothetical protein CTA1_10631 [Colletotrichum tanaceti]|uniref:Uncharacterized protein n=1 Tax=Colletotrichum tanaceti TaxID=1306861 RepID=A0A4U6XLK9_9PEZI|nr:hypothetical protein CTA1_10631 [Colletotrichum tanaceti]
MLDNVAAIRNMSMLNNEQDTEMDLVQTTTMSEMKNKMTTWLIVENAEMKKRIQKLEEGMLLLIKDSIKERPRGSLRMIKTGYFFSSTPPSRMHDDMSKNVLEATATPSSTTTFAVGYVLVWRLGYPISHILSQHQRPHH